jgi:hypothetical protein
MTETMNNPQCKFEKDWAGRCKSIALPNIHFCEEHSKVVCSQCGKQATHSCEETHGAFVCGSNLCDNCNCVCVTRNLRSF